MIAERPLTDLAARARLLSAFGVIVIVPGWLLIGRHVRTLDRAARLYLATGAGLLLTGLLGPAFAALQVPYTPESVTATGIVIALALGHCRRWRDTAAGLADGIEPLDARGTLAVISLTAIMAAIVLFAFRDYAAPNHLDDASNHAFMVSRVLTTHSLAAGRVFAPPYGAPAIPYLPGWHGCAALVADLGRVPAWVSAWGLAVFACILTPLALTLFWRAAALPIPVALLAGAFAVANFYMPTNIFSWGGFGAIIGLALAPWIALALRALILRPSAAAGILAGLALVAILHIHTSEIFTAALLLVVIWPPASGRHSRARDMARAVALALVVFALAGLLPLLEPLRVYREWTASEALSTPPGLRAAAIEFLTFTGGNVPILRWFVVPGLVVGLIWRRGRRVGLLSLAFLLLYFGVRQFQDPLSLTVSRLYYRQSPRVIYPQMYLLPPLMAAAVLGTMQAAGRLWRRRGRRLLALVPLAALVHWVLYPGAYWSYRNLEYQKRGVPFTATDSRLAREMTRLLPGNAVIANQYGDGSFWAMHVSGLRFLDPCSWALGAREGLHHRPAIARLLDRPWPPEARALRDLGTGYVYVGDTVLEGVMPPLNRARLDSDPRFARLLDDGDDAVYRILWDADPTP
jgi:hypothetical protein